MTMERQSFPLVTLLLVCALALGAMVLIWAMNRPAEMTISHALRRGHTEVVYISSQCNQNNYQLHMHNPNNNRDAFACLLDGKWGITITGEPIDGDNVVTAFWREKAQTLDDVIKYLQEYGGFQ